MNTKKIIFLIFLSAGLSAQAGVQQARELLMQGNPSDAIHEYQATAPRSGNASLVAEYSYALASAGFVELSLSQLDRAFRLDATNPEVFYFGSKVFESLGMKTVAEDLSRPTPEGFAAPAPIRLRWNPSFKELREALTLADNFMAQGRYASAAAYLHAANEEFSDEPEILSAYGVTLDKLGAFRSAGQAINREIVLASAEGTLPSDEAEILKSYSAELKARTPVEPVKANEVLQGRYYTFLGGGLNGGSGTTTVNITGRVGKFLTNHFSADFTAGYQTVPGAVFGLGGRWHQALPVDAPLNVNAGARVDYSSGAAANNFGFTLSPGLSWFITSSGSVDLIFDVALLGPSKGTQTLSLGYTQYF